MSKRSIKEQLAGYFSTYTKNKISGSDLFDQNEKEKWLAFYNTVDVIVPSSPEEKKTKLSEINDQKDGQRKLYDAAVLHGLFKKSQIESKEVKESGQLPFTAGEGDLTVIPLSQLPPDVYNSMTFTQPQQNMINTPVDDLNDDVARIQNEIKSNDKKQQAGSLLSSVFKSKYTMDKLKKGIKTANKKTRDRTAKQEQELKETKSKLQSIESKNQLQNDRLEQQVQARLDAQKSFYENQLRQEKMSNKFKLDPTTVAQQEADYKTKFNKEAKAQQEKLKRELENQLEVERNAKSEIQKQLNAKTAELQKLAKSSETKLRNLESKHESTLQDYKNAQQAGDTKEQQNQQKRLDAINKQRQSIKTVFDLATRDLESKFNEQLQTVVEPKLYNYQLKVEGLKTQLEQLQKLNTGKTKVDADQIFNLKRRIKDAEDLIAQQQIHNRLSSQEFKAEVAGPIAEKNAIIDSIFFMADQSQTQEEILRKLEKEREAKNIALELEYKQKIKDTEDMFLAREAAERKISNKKANDLTATVVQQAAQIASAGEIKDITAEQAQEIEQLNSQSNTFSNLAQNLAIPLISVVAQAVAPKGLNLPSIAAASTFAGLNFMRNQMQDNKSQARQEKLDKKEARKPKLEKDPDEPENKVSERKEVEVKGNILQNLLQQSLTILGSGVVAQEIANQIPPTSDLYRGLLRLTGVNVENIRDGEITYPGYNFLGPGTQINERLEEGIEPVNTLDKIAFEHDIEYSRSRNAIDIDNADQKMIQLIDQLLPNDGFAQLIAYTLRAKRLYEGNVGLLPHSQSVVEYNVNNLEQNDVDAYNNLLKRSRKLTYDMDPTVKAIEPSAEVLQAPETQPSAEAVETQPPTPTIVTEQTQPDIKTTQTINTIINMADSKTVPRLTLNSQTPANPNPFTLPPQLQSSITSRRGVPVREVKENKITYVAPRLSDRPPIRDPTPGPKAIEDQNDVPIDGIKGYRGDELQRGAGILKPKFIMPSVNILNRSDQEGYVDDLEFAMFDFVQDEGGNDPNGKNPLVKDQNITHALRYGGGGVTINSMFGEDLASYPAIFPKDKPDKLANSRIQEFFFGENRLPEMKFLYSNEFEAQEFNQSEFEVNEYDVNNERTAISALSPYADFTNNQLLDQFIDSSILYGVVP